MQMPQPDNALSAEEKLAIREEVERRLKDLPGETLKLIQAEVADCVSEKEKGYRVVGMCIALIFLIVWGITWNNLRERTNEIIRKTADVDSLHTNVLARFNDITNMYLTAFERHRELTNRIQELAGIDNLVTAQQLQKAIARVDTLSFQAEDALFTATDAAARAGDAYAFDRLKFWATNTVSRLAPQAERVVGNLVGSITGPFYQPYIQGVKTTWDLSLGFENARNLYSTSLPEARLAIIETIWNATNFPKNQRFEFLVTTAQVDSTIDGRRLAVDLINAELKTNFVVWHSDQIRTWWRSNSATYFAPVK